MSVGRDGGGIQKLLLVGLLLGFGLMAKPMLVTVPFVLLLLDIWPLGRSRLALGGGRQSRVSLPWGALVREKLPLLALCAISAVITIFAQRESAAVKDLSYASLDVRLANATLAYIGYLGKTIWPSNLAVLYPHSLRMPPWWQVTGSALLLVAASAVAVRQVRSRPYLVVGWLWFLGMLVPVIGLVQVGEQAMADRYTYLPALGLSLLMAWGLSDAAHRAQVPRTMSAVVAVLALGGLLAATATQVAQWKNSETLFRHTLAVTTGNALILNNLGALLIDEGRKEEAIPNLREALLVWPTYYNAHFNLAAALADTGRVPEAIEEYRETSRLYPDRFEIYTNLGIILARIGRTEEAISQFRIVLRLQPGMPASHFNLGVALTQKGRFDEAILHLREALRLQPGHIEYLRALELARSRASASRAGNLSTTN